jgi:hypothetical protein
MTVSDFPSCFDDGESFPPGFRFHPTDEELVLYYLKRKMCRRRLKLDIIGETDVYKWDPDELPGLSKLKTGDRLWFFFSPRDRKYPNAARSNRATLHGYWKVTGKDRTISCNSRSVGVKKTLVFYNGRAPAGVRTDWVMHEYTLDEDELKRCETAKDYYALYKVYKKSGPGPKNGEQYGAPFKEEEWADKDECSAINADTVLKQSDCVISSEKEKDDLDFDLEELLEKIADEDPVHDPQIDLLNQFLGEDEAQSTMFELYEGSAITSGPGQNLTQSIAEDFLEDFLEMDDLVGLETSVQNFKDPVENLLSDEMSRLTEVDLFQDLLPLSEVGPSKPGETVQSVLIDENQINDQIWTQDQTSYVFTPAEANQGVIPQFPGAVYDCNLGNQTENGGVKENDDVSDSWFSSALWSWLESVPTDTASASENSACIVKSNARNGANDIACAGPKRLDGTKSVFLCFLVVGIVCAMLLVLIRTSI